MKESISILMSATLLFALSSCNKPDIEQERDKNPIALNAMWERVSEATTYKTRATEITNVNIADFGVYAYYETDKFDQTTSVPQFMNNQKVDKLSGIWSYNPIMYWPPQGTISFFAYAPYAAAGSLDVSTKGMPIFDYSNPSVVSEQHDLLLSYPQIDKTDEDVNGERLPLKFKHALSNIVFKAGVLSSLSGVVKIESVTISSLKNRAAASFSKNIAIESGWDLDWTVDVGAGDDLYELSIANKTLNDVDVNGSVEPVVITSTNGHLMVIPQEIDAADQITVVLKVGSETKTTTVALNSLIAEFEPSKRYVISITVMSKVDIKMICDVQPWIEKEIDVPDFN